MDKEVLEICWKNEYLSRDVYGEAERKVLSYLSKI